MALNTVHFKLAVELAAPSLATRGLLDSANSQSHAVAIIVNAYRAVAAAQQEIARNRD